MEQGYKYMFDEKFIVHKYDYHIINIWHCGCQFYDILLIYTLLNLVLIHRVSILSIVAMLVLWAMSCYSIICWQCNLIYHNGILQ